MSEKNPYPGDPELEELEIAGFKRAVDPESGEMTWVAVGSETRRYRRVEVRLPTTIMVDRTEAWPAQTVDLSEGGAMVRGYHGPTLSPGRLVGVSIQGIVSDDGVVEDSAEEGLFAMRLLMRVVRHETDILALRFEP